MWWLIILAGCLTAVSVLSLAVISSRTPPPPPRLNLKHANRGSMSPEDVETGGKVVLEKETPKHRTPENPWHTATASWYGPGLYGNLTADGTRYTSDLWCVAHKSLPLGTLIDISYRGKVVRVPVKDRGPFTPGRDFDLSNAVASHLDFSGVGIIQWRVASK